MIEPSDSDFIEDFLVSTRNDNKNLKKRVNKSEKLLEEITGDSTEDLMIKHDIYNSLHVWNSRMILNQRIEMLFLLSKTFVNQISSLRNALSKLPARTEFDDLKNSLEGDRDTMIGVLKEIKDGFDKQKEQDEDMEENEIESEKIKDELRKKHGEHAIG